MDANEALRQIEEALEFIRKAYYFDDYHNRERQRLLSELASLRSLLEGDAGEDEVELDSILHTLRIKRFNQDDWQDVEHIDRARKLLSRLSAKAKIGEVKRCIWKEDEWHEYWETGCGDAFVFEAEGPKENNMKFCPFCGGSLELAALKEAGK